MTATPLKCLSVRQPWAHLIVTGSKCIENRSKPTKHRGWVLIHTGQALDLILAHDEYAALYSVDLPLFIHLRRGGIVGAARITGCIDGNDDASASMWFSGPYGYTLADARPLKFQPCAGMLGFFPVPGCVDLASIQAEAPELFSEGGTSCDQGE